MPVPHLPEPGELIAAAKASFNVTSDRDLALELYSRYGVKADQPAVNRWRRGLRGPGYEATVALLDAAGWLKPVAFSSAAAGAAVATEEARRGEEEAAALADREAPAQRKRKSA